MIDLDQQRAPRVSAPQSGASSYRRSPKTIYLALGLLFLGAAVILPIPYLRGQKLRLLILRNQIETSAAPGEPVLINDWLLYRALRWKGSPALQSQLRYIAKNEMPAMLLDSQGELVVAVAADDPLLAALHARGFELKQNASQAAWVGSGRGFRSPGHGVFRIYFAMRVAHHETLPAIPEDKP